MNFPVFFPSIHHARSAPAAVAETEELFSISLLTGAQSCHRLGSSYAGIPADEAAKRLAQCGHNLVTRERKPTIGQELWSRARNPLNALLLTLATVSYFLGDIRAAIVIAAMVILAITTAFIQDIGRTRPRRSFAPW
jgi:P-type Mg2+ transporter